MAAVGFDAGIRLHESLADGMMATRLCKPFRFVLVASPATLRKRGRPRTVDDLDGHECIAMRFATGALYRWAELGLPTAAVLGALGAWTQAGRAMFDVVKNVYRARELSREPLPMSKLRFANEREEHATRFLAAGAVTTRTEAAGAGTRLFGTVKDGKHTHTPDLVVDADARIVKATCSCNFFKHNKLFKGPCEHMLALRMHEATKVGFVT